MAPTAAVATTFERPLGFDELGVLTSGWTDFDRLAHVPPR